VLFGVFVLNTKQKTETRIGLTSLSLTVSWNSNFKVNVPMLRNT